MGKPRDVPEHEYYTPDEEDGEATPLVKAALASLEAGDPLTPEEKLALFKCAHARHAWAGIDTQGGYPAEAVIFADGTVVACEHPLTEHDGLEVTTLDRYLADLAANGFQWFEEDLAEDEEDGDDEDNGGEGSGP